jgi:hypothetical protein
MRICKADQGGRDDTMVMIDILSGNAECLLVAVAHGTVTAEDYEQVLIPAIQARLQAHKKVRLLYQLDRDFEGFTTGAMWDDAKFGLSHLTGFEAVALVTDVHWIADAVKFFSLLMRFPVQAFTNDQLDEAKQWVATTTWRSVADVPAA